MRSAAADAFRQEHITVARARGLPERLVLLHHVLRNACLPMITMIGLLIPALLAGIALTIADPRVRLHPTAGRPPHGAPV